MKTPAKKRCNKCSETKLLGDFYHDKNKKDGHSTICKTCSNENSTLYVQSHQEPVAAYKHEWYLDHAKEQYEKGRINILKDHEAYLQYLRNYHQVKWPQIYAKNIEWQQRHPELNNAINIRKSRKRRARRLGIPLPKQEHFTTKEIADRDGWICHLCHKPVPQRKLRRNHPLGPTLDHIDPDGPHTPLNVALAHRRCNSSRGRGRKPAQLRLLP